MHSATRRAKAAQSNRTTWHSQHDTQMMPAHNHPCAARQRQHQATTIHTHTHREACTLSHTSTSTRAKKARPTPSESTQDDLLLKDVSFALNHLCHAGERQKVNPCWYVAATVGTHRKGTSAFFLSQSASSKPTTSSSACWSLKRRLPEASSASSPSSPRIDFWCAQRRGKAETTAQAERGRKRSLKQRGQQHGRNFYHLR